MADGLNLAWKLTQESGMGFYTAYSTSLPIPKAKDALPVPSATAAPTPANRRHTPNPIQPILLNGERIAGKADVGAIRKSAANRPEGLPHPGHIQGPRDVPTGRAGPRTVRR